MIAYTKENGCYYIEPKTGKHFHLYEMMTYKGKTTSDIVAIWDSDNNQFINYTYGANTIGVEELENVVAEYVAEYMAKRNQGKRERVAKYDLTGYGVGAFCEDVMSDILDKDITGDFVISHAGREIGVPDFSENYEELERFLHAALENEDM